MGLLSLIPIRDWLYMAIIIGLIAGFAVFVHHERALGAQKIVAADKAATAREIAVAEANNAQLASRYEAKLQGTQSDYEAQLAAGHSTADALAASLSNYVARHRCASPVPAHPAGARGPNGPPAVAGSDSSITEATRRAVEAAAADAAELKALQSERASLNQGK
jgi:hypothetical protein